MKKILSLLCALAIIFTLCSCKSAPSSPDSSAPSSVNSALHNTSTPDVESVVEDVCKHTYENATCEAGSVCTICGEVIFKALGHSFVNGVCQREGCLTKDPDFSINWYTERDITISKAEVQSILSLQYKKPKNIIYMIGDGMGANDIALTEKSKDGCFDFGLVLNQIKNTGFATTYSNEFNITDSAAAGTALATGFKTNNNYVGISPTGEVLKNVSEIAREHGKKVGIVTNDDITGATPSAFTVHNISREKYGLLAQSFIKFKPDVLIGQGHDDFSSLDLREFVVASGLNNFKSKLNTDMFCEKPFIGFFSENIINLRSNTLAYCTEIALNRLNYNNKNGFFLMIENASTDKAGHKKNIEGKINGVITFDRAVATVLKFMKNNPDTLLVITSDHETGGVQLPQGEFVIDDSLFTTSAHTGENVRTFAVGYGTEYFNNKTVDNTDIAKFVINAITN